MSTLSRRALLAGLTGAAAFPARLRASEHPLKLVYPYPPGGAGDTLLRTIADRLHKSFGRPVVVENKTGAGGRLGAQAVKDAAADGLTVLFAAAAQFTLQPHALAHLSYDPFADFIPLSQTATFDQALTINAQIPARSLEEFAGWIKAHPEKATFGSPGAGTGAHFAGLEFSRKFQLALVHVPYRGTLAAYPDLLSGRIPMHIASSAELLGPHRRGEVRILATAGAARSPFLPDVPTLKENGIDIDAPGWFGFYVKSGTPPEIVRGLEKAILAATEAPDIRARIVDLGFQPAATTGQELGRLQRAQFDRWGEAVKASGFKPE